MLSKGVTTADGAAVLAKLNSLKDEIVPKASLCEKYSQFLKISNLQLLQTVVDQTVNGVVANKVTLPFFNGQQPPKSTNFLADPNALTALKNGLIAFFGGALGCSDGTIPPYTGADLKTIHKKMFVTEDAFNNFNGILLGVLKANGVILDDLNTVRGVLESTKNDIVPKYYPDLFKPNYLAGGPIAGIIIGAVIIALILAALVVGLVFAEANGRIPKFH